MSPAETETVAVRLPNGGWVDHIVWGTPDTAAAIETLADLTGVRANLRMAPAKDYPTLSAALTLGGETFFEIYGPNPNFEGESTGMHALLSSLPAPRLLTWFARARSLAQAARVLEAAGERFVPMLDEWERTDNASFRNGYIDGHRADPSVPLLIEWNDRRDMDTALVGGLTLASLKITATNPFATRRLHRLLGVDVAVDEGESNSVSVVLDSPKGQVSLI